MGVTVLDREPDLTTFLVEGEVCYGELRDRLIAFYLNDVRTNIRWDLSGAGSSLVEGARPHVLARVITEIANRPGKGKTAVYVPRVSSEAALMQLLWTYYASNAKPISVRVLKTW